MRKLALLTVILAVMGLPTVGLAGTIDGSPHDFSNTATYSWNTEQFKCMICHTPHHAGQTRLIWNHKLSTQSFTWDETKTFGGTTLPPNIGTWVGTTRLCLSCHDGTVAVGDLYHDTYGTGCLPSTGNCITGDAVIAPSGVMSNNHPVAIPYPYAGSPSSYNGIPTGSGVSISTFVSDPTASGIRLYTESGGKSLLGPTSGSAGMECGSCHNPHDNTTNTPFLRVSNVKNAICQACHKY